MNGLRNTLNALMRDESGQDLIEYALIAGLISVACIAVLGTLAARIQAAFNAITFTAPTS